MTAEMAGEPIQEAMREERRVVTALFADLVGSTALAEELDPEDVREVLGGAIERIVGSVEEFGGTIKDLAGDGVLALFGAPVAREDDPERAVRAALRIRDLVADYAVDVARDWGLDGFGVRVGIESGLVVVGPVGAGGRVEYGAVGDAINTAARLQSAASPATVLVGGATRALTEPLFDWGAERALGLKGKAEPVIACEVSGARAVPGRVRGVEGLEAPFVGREAELAAAAAAAASLFEGSGGVLLITGEPGLGKSRLLGELRKLLEPGRADGNRSLWLEGRCISYGQALPYLPFRELVRGWIGAGPDEAEARLRKSLRSSLTALFEAETEEEIHPYLGAMLGVTLEPAACAIVAALSPETRQQRTFQAMSRLLERLAETGPLIVAIEDMHWADASSLQLAEHLFPLAARAPICLVLTSRPEHDHPSARVRDAAAQRFPTLVHAIDLESLPAGADGELLTALVGESTLPVQLERRILASAEGNPYFLEELVRSLIDAGALARENGGWRFEHEVSVEVPRTVERVILARIDRLEPACHDVLTAGSVLGRHFGLALLEAVVEGSGVAAALSELQRLDFIRLDRPLPEPEYRFKHALIQETAYQTLLKKRRRELHRRAASALETLFAGRLDQAYGVLAHHYRAGGELDKALRSYEAAADGARRAYAVEESLELFAAALEVADALGLSPESSVVGDLRRRRGHVYEETGRLAEAQAEYETALRSARSSDERRGELRALEDLGRLATGISDSAMPYLLDALRLAEELGDETTQVSLLSRLAILEANDLRFAEGLRFAERAFALAEEGGEDHTLGRAMDALKMVAAHTGDWPTLERVLPRLEEIERRHNELWYLQFTLLESAFPELALARWQAGVARLEDALSVARRIGDRATASAILAKISATQLSRGRYGEALTTGRQALALADEVGYTWWQALAGATLGATLLELYELEPALLHLERGLAAAVERGSRTYILRCLGHAAWASWRAGDASRADELSGRAEQLIAKITVPVGRAFLEGAHAFFALAEVLLARGEPERARRLLQPILDAAEACGWQENIASAALLIGESMRALDGAVEAEPLLRRAADVSAAAGLPGLRWKVHAALAGLCRSTGRSEEAALHTAETEAIVEELAESVGDAALCRQFRDGALAESARRALAGTRGT